MNKLNEWYAAATAEEREALAEHAGTTVSYLLQIKGGHRRPGLSVALGIESGSKLIADMNDGRTPVVTCEELAGIVVETEGGEV